MGEIYIGLVTTMTEHYTDKGHLLIRNSDIKDGYFEFGENPIYLDEEFSEQNKSRMHQLGDVITVHTGDIGTSAVIGENEVNSIGFATIVTRPNQEILDSNYFATYLNTDTHKQWAVSMATGDGRSNYNLKDYTKLVVPIPEIEEQKKIAACIVNINSLITLHQRKPIPHPNHPTTHTKHKGEEKYVRIRVNDRGKIDRTANLRRFPVDIPGGFKN